MPEIPDYQTLMLPVLRIASAGARFLTRLFVRKLLPVTATRTL